VLGCVQRLFEPQVNDAAVRVLAANGIEVVIPPAQGCCGAMTHHQGELDQTHQLANDLIASFAGAGPLDAVLVAASGCGHTMKAYGQLASASFAAPVADIQEFLAQIGLTADFRKGLQPLLHPDGQPASAERPLRLAYHDACHMLHGQGISAQPRALLRAIPHIQLCEATEAGVCCGSAGIYNLVQPEEASLLGRLKADDLAATGADRAVSANIGCSLQIRRHMQESPREIPVSHPLQLLDQSYRPGHAG
jgi:glycolate oxidase iron-sulfur subunit